MNDELIVLLYQHSIRIEITRVRSEGRLPEVGGHFPSGLQRNLSPVNHGFIGSMLRYLGAAPMMTFSFA